MLQKQKVDIPFVPLDTRGDSKGAKVGTIQVLENAYCRPFDDQRHVQIVKRDGLTRLLSSGLTGVKRMFTRKGELLAIDQNGLWAYSPASAAWVKRASASFLAVQSLDVMQIPYGLTYRVVDCTVYQGLRVIVFTGTGPGTYYSVFDDTTGAVIVNSALIFTNAFQFVRVCGCNGYVVFYVGDDPAVGGGGGAAKVYKFATGTPASLSLVQVMASTANAGGDMMVFGNFCYIVCTFTGPSLRVVKFDPTNGATTVTDTGLGTGVTYPQWLAHDGADGFLYATAILATNVYRVVRVDVTNVTTAILSTSSYNTGFSLTTLTGVGGAIVPSTLDRIIVLNSRSSSAVTSPEQSAVDVRRFNSSDVFQSSFTRVGVMATTQAFTLGGNQHIGVNSMPSSANRSCLAILDLTNNAIAGHLLGSGQAAAPVDNGAGNIPMASARVTGSTVVIGALRRQATTSNNSTSFANAAAACIKLTSDLSATGGVADIAGSSYIPGAVTRQYDGESLCEAGFLLQPPAPVLTNVASGGSLGAGTFGFIYVYTWTDAAGRLHRSEPSAAATTTFGSGATNKVTFTTPTPLTDKAASVEVYRTIAGGTTYYLDASLSVNSASSSTQSDAAIATHAILYSGPGDSVLVNNPPPCSAATVAYKNRLWALSAEDGSAWYSKEVKEGFGVSNTTTFRIPTDGFDWYTGAAVLDDNLILFKRSSIHTLNGSNGPNDSAQPALYDYPQRVPTAVGTVRPRSIAVTPMGLIFGSLKGFWFLDRGLSAKYVGSAAEAYNAANVIDAAIIETRSHAYFATDTGRTLVYDFELGCWTTYTNQTCAGATLWGGAFTFATSTGALWQETAGATSDNGASIVSKADVMVPIGAIAGWGRLWEGQILGEYVGDHTLSVALAFDGAAAASETHTIAVTSPFLGSYRVRWKPKRGKFGQLRVTISDSFSSPSAGATWSGIGLLYGVIPGVARLAGNRGMTGP